jgi:hypothetical protein
MVKKTKQKQKKKSAKRKSKRTNANGNIKAYAHMIAHPCEAKLKSGMYGSSEGLLSSLKTTYSVGATWTNGYIFWCPQYVANDAISKSNCFITVQQFSYDTPVNTDANPFGRGGGGNVTSGTRLYVGATEFVLSSSVSDFRLVSSCMKVTYTGEMQAAKGQIAYIENIPIDTIMTGNAGNIVNVDQLFNAASEVERMGVTTHEIVYRPQPTLSSTFKTDGDSLLTAAAGAKTILTSESQRFSPAVYGFAWKGVPSSDLSFQFYQNVEWRPEVGSGFKASIPQQISPPGTYERVLQYLDSNYPGWTRTAMGVGQRLVEQSVQRAFTGTGPRYHRIEL